MTAFDDLERQLRAGVRREHGGGAHHAISDDAAGAARPGMAARPEAARDGEAAQPDAARPGMAARHEAPRSRRPWLRPPALALAAALVVAGGALAATGTIEIGPFHDDHDPLSRPDPARGAGVRAGAAKPLALRVADPAGGPPWTLRVFASSRGANCVQVGQVARGRFGVFVPPGTLEPLRAWPGGTSSLCSGQARAGFPVVRGVQRMRVLGGASDMRRCPARPHGDCPLTSVTLLRYGLLGPGARRVRLVDERDRTIASMATSPEVGGAYLFAIAQSLAPYLAADRLVRAFEAAFRREQRKARARGLSGLEAMRRAMRRAGKRPPWTRTRPPVVSVLATFADGRTLRVAGKGRTHATLPGLGTPAGPRNAPLPRDIPVRVRLQQPGRFATVRLSFRAPRAITRFDVHYTATLHGPGGRRCVPTPGGLQSTTEDIAAGETVRFVLRRRGVTIDGREGWCPGRFTGEIRYSTGGGNVVIGRYGFAIP